VGDYRMAPVQCSIQNRYLPSILIARFGIVSANDTTRGDQLLLALKKNFSCK
jgi:hypothetical protein